jgi:hypothetical protein
MKAIAGQPDFALESVHAVTAEGAVVIASSRRQSTRGLGVGCR